MQPQTPLLKKHPTCVSFAILHRGAYGTALDHILCYRCFTRLLTIVQGAIEGQHTGSCEDACKEQPAIIEGHPGEDSPERPHCQANACTH